MTISARSLPALPRAARVGAVLAARRLADPRTARVAVPVALLVYVAVWTITTALSKAGINIQGDMAEAFALSRDLDIGHRKHPPVLNWIVAGWFAVMPVAAWSFYLLAYVSAALALWFTWLAAGRVTDHRRRLLAVALLCFTPIFTFHAATYNHNIVQLPMWSLAALAFLVSMERRHVVWSVLFGLSCALAMLTKYYAAVLVLALLLASFLHPERRAYWRSPRPYVAGLACLLAVAPHIHGIVSADFVSLTTPFDTFAAPSAADLLRRSVRYLGAYVAYLAGVLLAIALLPRQPARTLADTVFRDWPPMRRVVACIALAPVILPMLLLPLAFVAAHVPWLYPTFFFAPLALVLAPRLLVTRRLLATVIGIAGGSLVVFLLTAPAVMVATYRTAVNERIAPYPALAAAATEAWRARSGTPLPFVSGNVFIARYVSFYSPDHPALSPNPGYVVTPEAMAQAWRRHGVVGLCDEADADCNGTFQRLVPEAERIVLPLRRSFLGMQRAESTFTIYVLPAATP